MRGEVFRLLDRKQAQQIVRELDRHTFVDGKISAGGLAAAVKHNLQVDRPDATPTGLDAIVVSAMRDHSGFQTFALPKRFVTPIFSRYEPGMHYGDHVDSALMGGASGVRTDLAMTLFLSPPDSYEGGELVIAGGGEIKLDCGEAYVYPANTVHHVAPVTRGVRLAAVTWMQSVIRDERMRAILYDLASAVVQADGLKNHALSLLLSKSYHNLLRYAAEP